MVNSHRRVDIYGYDASGSVSQLLTATGAVSATYGYTVYSDEDPQLSRGDTLKDSGTGAKNHSPTNSIRYTVKCWDSGSGMLDMGARCLGPSTSRFLQSGLNRAEGRSFNWAIYFGPAEASTSSGVRLPLCHARRKRIDGEGDAVA